MAGTVAPDLRYVLPADGNRGWRSRLLAHLRRLGPASRRNRFLAVLADDGLRRHAEGARPEVVIFAVVDGRLRGCAEVHATAGSQGRSAEIALSVEDSHQNRGIGQALLKAALKQCRHHHLDPVWVAYLPGNLPLRHLIDEAGFVEMPSVDPLYREARYRSVPPVLRIWRACVLVAGWMFEGLWTLFGGACKARG
ncbi:MAG: GNAT family N-acetyltransferase [Rhodobacteraceae bacterium]|nr:GNAT family N-acetyltransferase [Paracoccaceae bacterium]